ncbi:MauE/DoxX family redox-associated membrane protein [Mangrovicoccus sp. HB161399]|uniref:MauE/DoxX family redox-associated membrane protein n=1 Tax=Mangrovicoccus sp. HB161399 TaxID=2720392 RepID=UPI001554B0D4|nr:MauE/DoxX family redox-associated membrane protein [Mangrovicoccus sp. HB161399]
MPRDSYDATGKAVLWRMATPDHLCPFGLKSKALLERHGYEVEDHLLASREEVERFKRDHAVKTTPITWIGSEMIGGHDDLRAHFGDPLPDPDAASYRPVLAIFAVAALAALALSIGVFGTPLTLRAAEWFVAFSMAMLALQKLQDVESFSTMFLGYDLLARRKVGYAYLYPYLEAGAAVLMIGGVLTWLSAPVALAIGSIGALSVAKAVWIDKRELKCACAGGNSNVPLGFVSLSENLAMMAMGLWMPLRALGMV